MGARLGPVRTVDYHTAGEPFRIVVGGVPEPAGATVLERRSMAQASPEFDVYRELLGSEPRGHADMYGCFLVPPNDPGAHLGALFWHKDGYSTACGHGTIALGAWAVNSGIVESDPDGDTNVLIDVPSGRVTARVTCERGVVQHVVFRNIDSYILGRDINLSTSRGTVSADISYSGAIYASVSATSVGLHIEPRNYADLMSIGREVKWSLNDTEWAKHPTERRLDGIYATILYDDLGMTKTGPHQRNVTVFADGEVDRSPCGSGTSARLALLAADGVLAGGRVLTHDSIVGTTFIGKVVGTGSVHGRDAVTTEIEGNAYHVADCRFVLDPHDALGVGFTLR